MTRMKAFLIWILLFIFATSQFVKADIEVISTTCQYEQETDRGDTDTLGWMTCPPLERTKYPKTFREYTDSFNTKLEEQKFCCGDLKDRFCCSLAEKLKESPDFDPNSGVVTSSSHKHHYHHWSESMGFWSWLFVTTLGLLLFVLLIYLISCVFVEILEMLTYLICCGFCCCKRKKKNAYDEIYQTQSLVRREYQPVKTTKKGGIERAMFATTDSSSYQAINNLPPSYKGGPTLYQNVTPVHPGSEHNNQYKASEPKAPPPSYY